MVKSKFLSTILGLDKNSIQMDNFGPHTDTRTHRHTDTQTDTLLIFISIDIFGFWVQYVWGQDVDRFLKLGNFASTTVEHAA